MRFSDVIGQSELKEHLIYEINQDKISHAQLFMGKAGYGPLPLVLAFVQYLFCENKGEKDSCGQCSSCRKVASHQHPDVHYSFPTVQTVSKLSDGVLTDWREQLLETPYFNLNQWIKRHDAKERKPIIGKDESQDIIRKLTLRSFEGGYKVMIIWMAEEMNISCANKLLKVLEEPPNKTLFLLVSESSEKIITTILSRTQKMLVPRIALHDMSSYLRESKKLGASSADSLAGRIDGDIIEGFEHLGDHHEQDENRERFIQLMRVCYKKNVLEMLNWAESAAEQSREYQKVFLKYSIHMFRQSILKNYTEDVLTRVSTEESDFLVKFSQFITGNNILGFTKTFDDAHYHLERNANPKILFTQLCFQVMRYIHKA